MRISDWSSDVCSSDLHQHHIHLFGTVHFIGLPGSAENGIVNGYILSGTVGSQQRPENIQVSQVGNDLFNAHHCDVQFGESRAETSVAFIFRDADTTRVGNHEIRTGNRSEEHTSELQSLMRISYAVFCLKQK